jgi:hypothetical protein
MTEPNIDQPLPEDRRREIFRALVEAQDRGTPAAESRTEVAKQFGITPKQLRDIEQEGLNETWPPL